MTDEKKSNSWLPLVIAGIIGAFLAYLYLKNKNPNMTLQQTASMQSMSSQLQQPTINLDLSGLERRFENLEHQMYQLYAQKSVPQGTYLTASPTKSQPLVTAKVEEKIEEVKMDKNDSAKGFESISKGELKKEVYQDYYDVSATVTNATATDPNDYNSNVYDVHSVYNVLGRKAPIVYVINDAAAQDTDILYVVNSHYGGAGGSKEEPVYAHEIKEMHNIYEVKVRSPTKDLPYRVTEYRVFKQ